MITHHPTTTGDLEYVIANWRDSDRDEIMAQWWNDDDASYAQVTARVLETVGVVHVTRTAWLDGKPVIIWGAIEISPTVWQVFAFGTDDFAKAAKYVTKHIKRVLIPTLRSRGANVAKCWASVDHVTSCRWLEFLGATSRCELPVGKGGEMFRLYVWER